MITLICFECRLPTAVEVSGCWDDPAAQAAAEWVDEAAQALVENWEEGLSLGGADLDDAVDLADEWLGKGLWRLECPQEALAEAAAAMRIEPLVPISGKDADWLDEHGWLYDYGEPSDDGTKWCPVGQAAPYWFGAHRIRLFASFRCACWRDSLLPGAEHAQFRPLRGEARRFWRAFRDRNPRAGAAA